MAKPTTVDEYHAALSGTPAELLGELRGLARTTAPATTEVLKWGHPAAVHSEGTILFVYSAHKSHANIVFTPSTLEAFADELSGFETGKGRVKLVYGEPIPTALLKRMIQYRIDEFEQNGVNWK